MRGSNGYRLRGHASNSGLSAPPQPRVGRGAGAALTSAPHPAPPDEISAQPPAPPSAPGLAWASRSQGHTVSHT